MIFPHNWCSDLFTVDYSHLSSVKVSMRHIQDNDKVTSTINLNGGVTSHRVVWTVVI